jgi:hypothetical protein
MVGVRPPLCQFNLIARAIVRGFDAGPELCWPFSDNNHTANYSVLTVNVAHSHTSNLHILFIVE